MLQIVYHASKAGACTHQRLTKKKNPVQSYDVTGFLFYSRNQKQLASESYFAVLL